VKSNSTRPISATARNNSWPPFRSAVSGRKSITSIPAVVKTMGAVTTVFSSRLETRLYRNNKVMKMAIKVMV
jgi:hypothetical protein